MKSDSELKKDVMAELAWDPAIKPDAVGVAVKDGVVTLTGHLETFGEKFAIDIGRTCQQLAVSDLEVERLRLARWLVGALVPHRRGTSRRPSCAARRAAGGVHRPAVSAASSGHEHLVV